MKHFFHVTQKNNVTDERRKFRRYKCMLPAELLKIEGKDKIVERTSVHDFSNEGLMLIVNFITLDPGSNIELKLYVPEKELKASLKAEIAWKKFADDKLKVGLKLKEVEEEAKNEILSWVAPKWLEREREEKP